MLDPMCLSNCAAVQRTGARPQPQRSAKDVVKTQLICWRFNRLWRRYGDPSCRIECRPDLYPGCERAMHGAFVGDLKQAAALLGTERTD